MQDELLSLQVNVFGKGECRRAIFPGEQRVKFEYSGHSMWVVKQLIDLAEEKISVGFLSEAERMQSLLLA